MIKAIIHIFKDSPGSFEGQEPGEKVVLLLRRHPVVAYMRISLFLIAFIFPIITGFVFYSDFAQTNLWTIFLFFSSVWCLIFWLLMFYSLTMYTLNVVIVTDRRIIDNNQHGLFDRKVSELLFSRVQDISVHISGMLETFLKFGNLVIQSAGQEREFIFREIPRPEEAKNTIMQMVAESHKNSHNV